MLDPALLRANPAELAQRLQATRGYALDVSALESLESARKQLQTRTQELQNLRNTRSKAIGQAKAKGEDVSALMAEVAGFGEELKASEVELERIRGEIEAIALGIPNLPHASVPPGTDESRQCRTEPLGHAAQCSISRSRTMWNSAHAMAGWMAMPARSCRVRASPCCAASWRGCTGRWRSSCSTCTATSMATKKPMCR